ncbi:MAG: PD-(D/E)XK nuclease family protein [Armatimonadia bacterium]
MTRDFTPELPPEFHEQPLTARTLDDFALCPRKFLLAFFTPREQERRFRGGPAALHQAVRQALLDCYNLGGPAKVPLPALLDAFDTHWEGDLCTDSLEEEQLRDQGLLMLTEYHLDHVHDALEAAATDLRLEGSLGDQAFVAVADLVLQSGACRDYYRFATSRHPLTGGELQKDLSAQLMWLLAHDQPMEAGTNLRVLYYALRARRAYEVVLDAEQAEYARRDFASRAARLHREADFAPNKGKHCRWCRSKSRCPAWRR